MGGKDLTLESSENAIGLESSCLPSRSLDTDNKDGRFCKADQIFVTEVATWELNDTTLRMKNKCKGLTITRVELWICLLSHVWLLRSFCGFFAKGIHAIFASHWTWAFFKAYQPPAPPWILTQSGPCQSPGPEKKNHPTLGTLQPPTAC